MKKNIVKKNSKSVTKSKIRLGVNIDHCATLRQVRGSENPYPSLKKMVSLAKKGGAEQITIHLREDRRHIQDQDVIELCQQKTLPINLEMATSSEILKLALKCKPKWVCLVPEKRQELTTEGGLDVVKNKIQISSIVQTLRKKGIKVSTFIEADATQIMASCEVGVDAVEFHTGAWVLATRKKSQLRLAKSLWQQLVSGAKMAHRLELFVHAGHGLDLLTTKKMSRLPHLRELNIGHSIVCHSLLVGMTESVRLIKQQIKQQMR